MRPECVIVIFKNRIYLYGIPEFAIIGQIDTYQSETPLVGLSMNEQKFVLALPSVFEGNITMRTSLEAGSEERHFVAHAERRVQTLAVSFDGRFLASTSVNGKRVKIFNIDTL